MKKLWAGMIVSAPVLLWRPDGTIFHHQTYTEAATHIAREIDEHSLEAVGEIAYFLAVDGSVMTSDGSWSIVPQSLYPQLTSLDM